MNRASPYYSNLIRCHELLTTVTREMQVDEEQRFGLNDCSDTLADPKTRRYRL